MSDSTRLLIAAATSFSNAAWRSLNIFSANVTAFRVLPSAFSTIVFSCAVCRVRSTFMSSMADRILSFSSNKAFRLSSSCFVFPVCSASRVRSVSNEDSNVAWLDLRVSICSHRAWDVFFFSSAKSHASSGVNLSAAPSVANACCTRCSCCPRSTSVS